MTRDNIGTATDTSAENLLRTAQELDRTADQVQRGAMTNVKDLDEVGGVMSKFGNTIRQMGHRVESQPGTRTTEEATTTSQMNPSSPAPASPGGTGQTGGSTGY